MTISFKHKLRSIIKRGAYILTKPKQPDFGSDTNSCYRTILCNRSQMTLVSETNSLFHVVTETDNGYFCPCRRHDPIQEYVSLFVADYFSFITPWINYADVDKKIITDSLQNPDNFEKFINMGGPLAQSSACALFLSSGDPNVIGLVFNTENKALTQRMKYFVSKFAWCQLNAYVINQAVGIGQYHTRSSNISLATEALAGLLGLTEMFPHGEYVYLSIDGQRKLFGIYTECAKGQGIIDISHERRRLMLTPQFQRQMSNLNVLDVISHEMDHSPNNYFVTTDSSGMASGVSVFDNNGIGTFSLNKKIAFTTYKHCSPFILSDGTVNRPYLDRQLVERIFNIRKSQLHASLAPYLRFVQIHMTYLRLQALQTAITKTVANNKHFLLSESEWSNDTIQTELSGHYGKTYLESFLYDCCVPND